MKRNWLLFSLAILLSACNTQEEAPVQMKYGTFYLRYIEDGQEIKTEASFTEKDSSGKRTAIPMEGGVSFQSSAMRKREVGGIILRYQYENYGSFPEKINFRCRENKEDDWRAFSTKMIPAKRFTLPDSILKSEATSLILPDGSLTDSESLIILFSDEKNQTKSIQIDGPSAGNSLPIPAQQLSEISPGLNIVYLVKKQRKVLSEQDFEVILEVEYYSDTQEVLIKE